MKVLYVITKSNWGGAQAYVYTLAKAAQERGDDVAVALGGTGEPDANAGLLAERLQEIGIRVVFVKSFMRDVRLMRELSAIRELVRIYRHEQPDVVHLNSSKAGGIGALAGRLTHVPRIVFTSHGLAYDEKRAPWARGLIWLFTWLTILLTHATIVISTDTYARARRLPFCRKKTQLVFNGVRPIAFLPRERARAALWPERASEPVWVGIIAELTRNKSFDTLLLAFSQLKKQGVHAPLVIIGGGEEQNLLERIIAEEHLEGSVRLAGYLPGAAQYLTAFDVFTLVSTKEGLPYVLLEAGEAGCAVLATHIAGTTDVIDEKTGVLVPPRDSARIAQALSELIADSGTRAKLSAALHERVREKFSYEQMLTQTFALYAR